MFRKRKTSNWDVAPTAVAPAAAPVMPTPGGLPMAPNLAAPFMAPPMPNQPSLAHQITQQARLANRQARRVYVGNVGPQVSEV